jgi:hypothetical protein
VSTTELAVKSDRAGLDAMEENQELRQRMSKRSFYVNAFVCLSASEKEIETLDAAGVVRDVDNSRGC